METLRGRTRHDKTLPCEGGEVAQLSCGCPVTESVQGRAGRNLEQWKVSLAMRDEL